jgi:hypothetical protein
MPRIPLLSLLCFAVLSPASSLHAQEQTEAQVWHMVATYLTKEAQLALADLPPPDPASQREREFCAAVVLLDQQPVTEARLDESDRRLAALIAAEPSDDIAHAGLYLRGRIAQVFRAEPDHGAAAAHYRALLAKNTNDHWTNLARVKLALLQIYVLPAATPAARIDAVEAMIPGVTDRITLRDLHRLTARGILFYSLSRARALAHLLKADAIGGLRGNPAADLVVQICELAWDLGDRELAAVYREKLRTEYPRDARIFMIERRFAGEPVPTGSHGRKESSE